MRKILDIVLPLLTKLIISIMFIVGIVNNWLTVSIISICCLVFIETLFFLFKREKNAVTTLDQMLDNISYQFPLVLCVFGLVLSAQVPFWILVVYVVMYVVISLIYYYLHLVSVRTITNTTLHIAVVPMYLAVLLSIINSFPSVMGALDVYSLILFILALAIYAVGFVLFVIKYAHYFKFRRRYKERKTKKTK